MNSDSLTFSIMSMNVRFGLADDGENSWENRKKAYPALFMEHNPDFIGFQEVNDFQAVYLNDVLENHTYIGARNGYGSSNSSSWQDNLIFYRKSWVCETHHHYFLSDTPDIESRFPDSKWPRQCIIGLFKNNGRSLIHVNTHFDFSENVQERSACVVLEFLKNYRSDIPVVITGDFNTSPDSRTYEIFKEHGFKDLFGSIDKSTFHGFTGKDLGGRIDWILFKGPVEGVEHLIIKKPFNGIYPSDHYPVKAVFRFL